MAWHPLSTATTSTVTRRRILLVLIVRRAGTIPVPATAPILRARHPAQEYFPKTIPGELGGVKPLSPSFSSAVLNLRLGPSLVFERKKEVSGESARAGLEPSELLGQAVGYEGLAGRDSVDAAYLLNGLFQKLLRTVGPESRQYVERSRYRVCLCKVRDSLEFPQNRVEAASNLQESERECTLPVWSVGAVDDALEGYGRLSICDAWNAPDLLHRGEGLRRLVGSKLDHKIESSRYRCCGFDVGKALDLGNCACTFSFAFGEYVACLVISCHFFLP